MDTNFPHTNQSAEKPSFWVANPHLKALLLLLVFVFLVCGIFLVLLMQWQKSYRQKIYAETQNSLPRHLVKVPNSSQ